MRNTSIAILLSILAVFSFCKRELIDVEADGIFTDPRDSINYPYVTIGNQIWMAKNLAYVSPKGSYAYDDEDRFVKDYGRLYTFDAAERACPDGWHLPSDKDWKDLEVFLGMDLKTADSLEWRRSGDVALALKNKSGWWSGGNGANTSRFSALPGGFRTEGGRYEVFGDVGTFWTSSYASESHSWGRGMVYYETGVYRWKYNKMEGYSVRCLKN